MQRKHLWFLFFALPAPAGAAEPFTHLPSEEICALCYKQCENDCRDILTRMDLVGGWQRHQLIELRTEAERLRTIWYAAWWITWKEAQAGQRQEWADNLIRMIGQDCFWRGELPLPLSIR